MFFSNLLLNDVQTEKFHQHLLHNSVIVGGFAAEMLAQKAGTCYCGSRTAGDIVDIAVEMHSSSTAVGLTR